MNFHGLNIVPHTLALQILWTVQRHPIKKRRRGWAPVRVTEPGCLQMGNTLFLHPDLVEKLKEATP